MRPQRRKQRASRNPLKTLSQRVDAVHDVYVEQLHGVAEREMKRLKTEQSTYSYRTRSVGVRRGVRYARVLAVMLKICT